MTIAELYGERYDGGANLPVAVDQQVSVRSFVGKKFARGMETEGRVYRGGPGPREACPPILSPFAYVTCPEQVPEFTPDAGP